MALKPELKSWLEHVGPKLSDNVRTILSQELEKDDVAAVWRETVMARSDYSRAQDDLRKEGERLKTEAEEATRKAEAWYSTNTKWREDNEAKHNEALKAREQADAELAIHRAKIKVLAEQGLIDPEDPAFKLVGQPITKAEPKGQYLTQEALDALLAKKEAAMGSNFADAFTFFEDLADEHFQLTGQRLKRQELLEELKKSPNSNLQQVWEKKHNILQVRADIAAKAEQERTQKAVAEALAKDRSERATDAHAFRPRDLDTDSENKHILSLFPEAANAAYGSEAVRAAKASWERGEFRQPTAKPA